MFFTKQYFSFILLAWITWNGVIGSLSSLYFDASLRSNFFMIPTSILTPKEAGLIITGKAVRLVDCMNHFQHWWKVLETEDQSETIHNTFFCLVHILKSNDHDLLKCSSSLSLLFLSSSLSLCNPSSRAGSASCCAGKRIRLQRTGRSGKTSPWSGASWASRRPNATPSTSRRAAPGSSTTTSDRRTWCTFPLTSYRWARQHVSHS